MKKKKKKKHKLAQNQVIIITKIAIETINHFPLFSQQPNRTQLMEYLRNKHDTDGDTGHEIDLKILFPFIGSNPTAAREQELDPFEPRLSPELRAPP